MEQKYEDTYFFDRDLAYQTALAHNPVLLDNGDKLEQICYYDGDPFEHAPDNLVHVPSDEFEQYFSIHQQRIPSRIDATLKTFNEKTHKLEQRLYGLLKTIKKLRQSPYQIAS